MMGRHDDDGWELIHYWSASRWDPSNDSVWLDSVRDVEDIQPIDLIPFEQGKIFLSRYADSYGQYLRYNNKSSSGMFVNNTGAQHWGYNWKIEMKVRLPEVTGNDKFFFDKSSLRGVSHGHCGVGICLTNSGQSLGLNLKAGGNTPPSGNIVPCQGITDDAVKITLELYSNGIKTGAVCTVKDMSGAVIGSKDLGYFKDTAIDFGGDHPWDSTSIWVNNGEAWGSYGIAPCDWYYIKIMRTDILREV